MARYFKVTEIDRDSFIEITGEDLDCCQFATESDGIVYVAVDDYRESEMEIPMYLFDEEE